MATFPIKEIRGNVISMTGLACGHPVTEVIFGCPNDSDVELLEAASVAALCFDLPAEKVVFRGYDPLRIECIAELVELVSKDNVVHVYTRGGRCPGHRKRVETYECKRIWIAVIVDSQDYDHVDLLFRADEVIYVVGEYNPIELAWHTSCMGSAGTPFFLHPSRAEDVKPVHDLVASHLYSAFRLSMGSEVLLHAND